VSSAKRIRRIGECKSFFDTYAFTIEFIITGLLGVERTQKSLNNLTIRFQPGAGIQTPPLNPPFLRKVKSCLPLEKGGLRGN